jgi:minor histocompatibility antigen H13
MLGLSFSTTAIQLLNLDSFWTGGILLAGLFFYDVFWVFFTPVMVTVAKSFDAPIKLVWPKDISELVQSGWLNIFRVPEKGVAFTMLGLGDIVIPGIFIALALRFDHHNSSGNTYFRNTLIAYILGLVTTVFVMHTFKAAQPALLYLSPACIFAVLGTAWFRGEVKEMFAYSDDGEKEVVSVEHAIKSVNESKKKVANGKPALSGEKEKLANGTAEIKLVKENIDTRKPQDGLNNRQRRALKRQESASAPAPVENLVAKPVTKTEKKVRTEEIAGEISDKEMAAAFLKNKSR